MRRFADRPNRPPTYPELLQALNHPLRRRILRTLHEAGEARSPIELSQAFDTPLSNVSYHVKVLREKGAIALTDRRPVRGTAEHFYFSVLPENRLAVQLLDSTRREDRP
jgi:DNA-binding transcriptional ArsR family regulator